MIIARKLLLPALIFFAFLLASLVAYFSITTANRMQSEENNLLIGLSQAFDQNLQARAGLALGLARQVAGSPEVAQAVGEGDRLRLVDLTLNAFKTIQPRYHLTQQQYIKKPARVLLRLQDIPLHGDDLSDQRPALLDTLARGADTAGLELTADGLSLRGIAGLGNPGQEAAIDIGMAVDQNTLLELKDQLGGDWQISLSRAALQRAGGSGTDVPPDMSPTSSLNLLQQASTLDPPIFASPQAYQQALQGQPVITRLQDGQRTYALVSFPLLDSNRQVIGVVDALLDRTQALATLRRQIAMAITIAILGLLAAAIAIAWVTNTRLERLNRLALAAQDLASGSIAGAERQAWSVRTSALSSGGDAPVTSSSPSHRRRLFRRQVLSRSKPDEIDTLASSLASLARQIERLAGRVDEAAAERTADLERRTWQLRAVAEIAREVTAATELQALLEQAVQLVRQRFDFYHAGVFLVDEKGEWAVLRAATGEAGRTLIEAGHRLRVARPGGTQSGAGIPAAPGNPAAPVTGIVGTAAGSGQPHVSQDVFLDPSYFKNPRLPETRSEIAIPLRLGSQVIGVLDVQSRHPNAFDEGDIAILQLLADQLAIALNNARLIEELNRSMQELEQAYNSVTRQTWSSYMRSEAAGRHSELIRGYRSSPASAASRTGADQGAHPASTGLQNLEPVQLIALSPEMQQALSGSSVSLQQGQPAVVRTGGGASSGASSGANGGAEPETILAVPIQLRGQGIGVIQLRFQVQSVPQEVVDLVGEVGNRMGLVLESARLLHEAQRLAAREQQINWIANQMRSTVDLDAILQNTVRELGKALGARRTYIQLGELTAVTEEAEREAVGRGDTKNMAAGESAAAGGSAGSAETRRNGNAEDVGAAND